MVPVTPDVFGLHGLRIRSVVPLAGVPLEGTDYDLDVSLGASSSVPPTHPSGRLLLARAGDGAAPYAAAEVGDRVTLRLPGVCDFVFDRRARTVECRADPELDTAILGLIVAGLVVAFWLSLEGHFVLHASAVEIDGRAIAFAGDSGSGKSTLAALLCAAGARLITDDVLRLGMTTAVVCLGGAPMLRLRPSASWVVEHFQALPPCGATADNRLGVQPAAAVGHSVPLAMIILPRPSKAAKETDLQPVTGARAFVELARCSRVVGWMDPELMSRQFDACGHIAETVPVVEATVPWEPSRAASIGASLLGLVLGATHG